MSTGKDKKEFDYHAHVTTHGPEADSARPARTARRKRRQAAKQRITIRVDEDILEEFRRLVPQGRGYQRLMNQALREWLAAKGIKDLVREELSGMVREAIASVSDGE